MQASDILALQLLFAMSLNSMGRMVALRRSLHARPTLTSAAKLPLASVRQITTEPSSSSSSAEHPDPSTYNYVAASGSQHSFAAAAAPISESSSTSSSPNPFSVSGGEHDPIDLSNGISVVTNLPVPPESSGPSRRRELLHPFDSYAFVTHLKESAFQAGSAKAAMEAVRALVVDRGDRTASSMLNQEDRENVSHVPSSWDLS